MSMKEFQTTKVIEDHMLISMQIIQYRFFYIHTTNIELLS